MSAPEIALPVDQYCVGTGLPPAAISAAPIRNATSPRPTAPMAMREAQRSAGCAGAFSVGTFTPGSGSGGGGIGDIATLAFDYPLDGGQTFWFSDWCRGDLGP